LIYECWQAGRPRGACRGWPAERGSAATVGSGRLFVGKAWRRASAPSPAAVCCCWKPARLAVPQGRVIGSAVDAAVAMRARPADFARWAKRGIEGWSWDEARAPLVSSTVVGMADAIATGRTSDVAAARSQAEAALGCLLD
jgi:choline dehydrogenase-like flavoprotein